MCKLGKCGQFTLVTFFNVAVFISVLVVYKCVPMTFMGSSLLLGIYVIVQTLEAMIFTGCDKLQAEEGGWRFSEIALISSSFFCGTLGAVFCMVICNHKTSKPSFFILVLLTLPFNAAWVLLGLAIGVPSNSFCGFIPGWNATGFNGTRAIIGG